jgi:hypothetical protein
MLTGASLASMMNSVNINSYGAIEAILPLHVSGQWIVDSKGNRVQLRGVGCAYNAYGRNAWGTYFGGGTAWLTQYCQWMKQTGCNCMRLIFQVPDPKGTWNFTNQDIWYDTNTMNQTLNILQQNGIYAILCDATPLGTVARQGGTGILPNYESYWLANWVSIANSFKNDPTIAMYELCNEPYDTSWQATMQQYYYDCINAIRATGDNHIVQCWAGDFSNASQILPNMCLNLHYWDNFNNGLSSSESWFPEDSYGSSASFTDAEIYASQEISTLLQLRQTFNCPVILGEFGVYNYSMSSPDVYDNQLKIQMLETYGIPWQAWSCDGFIQNQYGSNGAGFWDTFVSQKLGGAFTSNYVPSSVAWNQAYSFSPPVSASAAPQHFAQATYNFTALPFNIWNCINSTASQLYLGDYFLWGVCSVSIPSIYSQYTYSFVFKEPCALRVQEWSGSPYWGTVVGDYYITLSAGQTTTINSNSSYTDLVVYAWA